MQTNRSARRAMRAAATDVAARAAAACYDYTASGALVRVSDPRAVAVLRRAFAMMLRSGEPVTLQISEAEAASFPRWSGADAGMVHVMAAWIDVDGRCAYHIRSGAMRDPATGETHAALSADLVDALARASLAELCATSGFPIDKTEGRA